MTNNNQPRPGVLLLPPGVFNVHKEKGFTSHDVVAVIRKITGIKRVGHTGTLDPNATGVLPICVGRATKLSDYLMGKDKTYIAEVVLGITTDSGDMTGNVLSRKNADCSENEVTDAVLSFKFSNKAEYLQIPPMYSAIKIGGKKLYELARKGEVVERQPRPVIIHDIRVLEFFSGGSRFLIEVNCSKGTYIRSLCMDIGEVLGTGAAMGDLIRTKSGGFSIENAVKLADIKAAAEKGDLKDLLIGVEKAFPCPVVYVGDSAVNLARNGASIDCACVRGGEALRGGEKYWLAAEGGVIGLFYVRQNKLFPEVML